MTPTSEFKAGKQKQGSMVKRFLDLLWPQKKLFFYAILSSVILTIIGIASSMYNKILMDEILPYGLKSLLVAVILVFSIVNVTSALISMDAASLTPLQTKTSSGTIPVSPSPR